MSLWNPQKEIVFIIKINYKKKKEKWEECNFTILLQQWSFYLPVQTGYNTSMKIELFLLSYILNT